MNWYWYLLGGVVALFLIPFVLDFFKEWSLVSTAQPYSELTRMLNTFDEWKGNKRSVDRFVELIRDSRRLPRIDPNDNPDVIRLQTP